MPKAGTLALMGEALKVVDEDSPIGSIRRVFKDAPHTWFTILQVAEISGVSVSATSWIMRDQDYDGYIIYKSRPKRWRLSTESERSQISKLTQARRRAIFAIVEEAEKGGLAISRPLPYLPPRQKLQRA